MKQFEAYDTDELMQIYTKCDIVDKMVFPDIMSSCLYFEASYIMMYGFLFHVKFQSKLLVVIAIFNYFFL